LVEDSSSVVDLLRQNMPTASTSEHNLDNSVAIETLCKLEESLPTITTRHDTASMRLLIVQLVKIHMHICKYALLADEEERLMQVAIDRLPVEIRLAFFKSRNYSLLDLAHFIETFIDLNKKDLKEKAKVCKISISYFILIYNLLYSLD